MFSLDNIEQMTHFSGWIRYFLIFLGIILINSIFVGIPFLIWSVSALFDPQKQKIFFYAQKIGENISMRRFTKKEKNEKKILKKPRSVLFLFIFGVFMVVFGLIVVLLFLLLFFQFPFLFLILFIAIKNEVSLEISISHLWLNLFLVAGSTFVLINLYLGHIAGNLHEVITPKEYLIRVIKQINIDESSFYLEFLGEIDKRFQTMEGEHKIFPKNDDKIISNTLKEMQKKSKTIYSCFDIYLGYLSIKDKTVIKDYQVYQKLYPQFYFSIGNCCKCFFRCFAYGNVFRFFRIFLPLYLIDPISFSAYDGIALTVIILAALNFVYFTNNFLENTAKSRKKKLNSLRRLSNMISFHPIIEDLIPKELPSINIFCIFTIHSWSSLRKLVMCKNKLQDVIYDLCYSFYYLYAFGIIIILILDYYGVLWNTKSIMSNTLLFSCMGLDAIYFLVWMIGNLMVNAQINEHYNIDKKTITDHIAFLKKISINIEYVHDLKTEFNDKGGFLTSFAVKRIIRETTIYLNLNSEEEVEKIQISRYIENLIKTLEGALSQLNIDNERNSELFLGLFSVNFTLFKSLITALLPIVGSLIWTYINKNKKFY